MRTRFLTMLFILSLSATGWGAEPRTSPDLDAGIRIASPTAVPEAEIADSYLTSGEGYTYGPGATVEYVDQGGSWWSGYGDRLMFRADFLYWKATDPRQNGVLLKRVISSGGVATIDNFSTGLPNTDFEMGFRTFVGMHLNDNWSVELGGHWVHDFTYPTFFTRLQMFQNDGTLNAARVFLTPLADETSNPAALPDAASRELTSSAIIYEIENHGVESNLRGLLHEGPSLRVDAIVGLRYFDYDEKFGSRLQFLNGAVADERFLAQNALFGPQIGAEGWYRLAEYVSLRSLIKFGFTANFQDVKVSGPVPGNGVLTGAGNLSGSDGTAYATVIEMGMSVVGQITQNSSVSLGYNAVWLSDVVRAMDQLDLGNIDSRSPLLLSRRSEEVWLQGFNASLRINY